MEQNIKHRSEDIVFCFMMITFIELFLLNPLPLDNNAYIDYLLLVLETWTLQPKTDATPEPCAYFSFVNLGDDRIVTIGGNIGKSDTTNAVYILHLPQMVRSTTVRGVLYTKHYCCDCTIRVG